MPDGTTEPWRMFLICHDWKTCTATHHVGQAKARWRDAMNAPTILEAAAIAHYRCDMWAQASHGGTFISMAERHCGKNAIRHIVCIANKPWLIDAWLTHRAPKRVVVESELALFA